MTVFFGAPPLGPTAGDYSAAAVQTDYTDPAQNMGPTYPGAGTMNPGNPQDWAMPIFQSAPPLVDAGSSPSEWALPNFSKTSPAVLALGATLLVAGLWVAFKPVPRRRRRARA